MALTGTLLADFSAFSNEAAKATAAVKGLGTSADTAAAQLSKIGEGVNIKSTISDPMGTATTIATQYAESLGTLGVAAVGLTTGVAALGVALFELGSRSAEVIAKFDDLADKTGMSVPALSRLSNASQVIGADLGQLTDVVFKLEQRMGENSVAFQKGMSAMGLSTEDLKAAGPDHYLDLVTAGLQGIADPAARAAAGTEVLGKGYRDVAHALNDLATGLELTKDIEPWTEQQAKDAEAFGFQVAALEVHVKALGLAIGADLIPMLSTLVGWLEELRQKYNNLPDAIKTVISPANLAGAAFREVSAAIDVLTGKTGELPLDLDKATKAMATANDVTQQLKINVPGLNDGLAATRELMADLDPKTRAAAAETKKFNDAMAELTSAGDGWKGTLDTIDGAVVESIISARAAGVSMQALGVIYSDLSDTQKASIEKEIAARAKQTTEAQKELDAQAKLEAKTIEETTKLWDAYEVERTKQMGTVTDIARAENTKQYNDAAATANKMGIVDAQYWDALEARWKQKSQAIGMDWAALTKAATTESKAGLQQIADGAQATYQEALKHVGEWSDSSIEKFRTTAEEAQKAADMFGTGWDANAKKAAAATGAMADAVIGSIHAITMASQAATIAQNAKPYADTAADRLKTLADDQAKYGAGAISIVGLFGGVNPIQTRDSGGPVVAGQSYLIGGGKAPELFTPGASGFVTPGGGGGSHVTQNIYITQPLGTADAIARAVADAQVQLMRGQGVRLPYGT
jgi:hypothetical protein